MSMFHRNFFCLVLFVLLLVPSLVLAGDRKPDLKWLGVVFNAGDFFSSTPSSTRSASAGVQCTNTDAPSMGDTATLYPAHGGSGYMIGNSYPLDCDMSGWRLNDSSWLHIDRIVRPFPFSTTVYAYFTADPNLSGQQRIAAWEPFGNSAGGGIAQAGGCVKILRPSSPFYAFSNQGGEMIMSVERPPTCAEDMLSFDDPSVRATKLSANQWKIIVDAQNRAASAKWIQMRYGTIRKAIKLGPINTKKFEVKTKAACMCVRG